MKKYNVIVLPMAKDDVRLARQWYNLQQKGLGKKFNADMAITLNAIRRNPFSFAIRYGNQRCAVFNKFPYAAHFGINEPTSTVYITAILHTSRHPDTGKDRPASD